MTLDFLLKSGIQQIALSAQVGQLGDLLLGQLRARLPDLDRLRDGRGVLDLAR